MSAGNDFNRLFGALRFVLDEPFALGIGEAEKELLAFFLECVGDVFEEDEAKADVLVFRSVHVPAHLVGSGPKLGFKVERGAVGRFLGFGHARGSLCSQFKLFEQIAIQYISDG